MGNRAPIAYRLDLIENLEVTSAVFEPKKVGILKSGLNNHLAFFMVTLFGISN